jgi:hypothetical protein
MLGPNGSYNLGLISWDSTGTHVYGRAPDIYVTVNNPVPSPTPTPIPTTFAALIGGPNVGSSYVFDGGFFQAFWGFPKDVRAYLNNQPNPQEKYTFTPIAGGYSICNTAQPACLTDGSDSLVNQGQGTDAWVLSRNGSGWSIRNARTKRYMGAIPRVPQGNVPMRFTPFAEPLTLISGQLPG